MQYLELENIISIKYRYHIIFMYNLIIDTKSKLIGKPVCLSVCWSVCLFVCLSAYTRGAQTFEVGGPKLLSGFGVRAIGHQNLSNLNIYIYIKNIYIYIYDKVWVNRHQSSSVNIKFNALIWLK